MGAVGKVVKADVALHLVKVAAAGLGMLAAVKGLHAVLTSGKRKAKS